jgi:hypothetical protein
VTDTGEQCDNGASNSNTTPNACRTTCQNPVCGDGIHDTLFNEQCDDGGSNSNQPNACRTTCELPRCGDGVVDNASPFNEDCERDQDCQGASRCEPPGNANECRCI